MYSNEFGFVRTLTLVSYGFGLVWTTLIVAINVFPHTLTMVVYYVVGMVVFRIGMGVYGHLNCDY